MSTSRVAAATVPLRAVSALGQLLRLDEVGELGGPGSQIAPGAGELERRERRRWELAPHGVELPAADRERECQPLDARVVTDDHHGIGVLVDSAQPREQVA